MAFFPRHFHHHNTNTNNNNSSFTPLFRLLDDFDNYSRQNGHQSNTIHWQPKFDVRETEQAYELHGEFPGVNKENVRIEFTEPQTMVIRGKSERTYSSGTPIGLEDTAASNSITENGEAQKEKTSHQATVEDETNQSTEKPQETKQVQPVQKKPVDKAKYWLTERTVGEFSRTFNFPTRVDQEAVTANFNDGILTVVVPKAKKYESRRIAVL